MEMVKALQGNAPLDLYYKRLEAEVVRAITREGDLLVDLV
jgi:hypothetical protein